MQYRNRTKQQLLHILLYCDLQVKENFERFISCKSTIDDIHVRLRKAEGDYGDSADGASTADMVAAVTDVSPSCKPAICVYTVDQK